MIKKFALGILTAALTLFGSVCFAKNDNQILVIDIEKIANESLAGKDMQAKIQKKQNKIQAQIEEKKTELTKKAQQLQEKKAKMPPAEFEEKANNLQNEIMVLDAKFQEDIEDLQKKQQKASQVIIDKVKDVASQLASKKDANLVVASNSVFYSSSKIDITTDVIKKLDSELKTVDID